MKPSAKNVVLCPRITFCVYIWVYTDRNYKWCSGDIRQTFYWIYLKIWSKELWMNQKTATC
jgi:hypothetical protein